MFSDDYNNEEVNEEYSEDNSQFEDTISNQNKKKLWIVVIGIVLVIILIIFLVIKNNGNSNPIPVIPNLLISSHRENLSISNNIQLSASVTNFQNTILTWTSSNPLVATVDQNGLVSGVGYGTTIITATYLHTDNMPYSVSCEVVVAEGNPNVKITNVRFQEGEILISVGSEYDLPVIIEPSDGYRTNVSYTSSNEGIVTVDSQGGIKAIDVGEAVISLDFNNGQYKDEINVNVTNESVFTQVFIPVTNIEFTDKLLKLKVDETKQLNYQILPQEALTSYLRWESSNEEVAIVNNGIVTALAEGTTDITLTSLDGFSEIMTVEVVDANVYVTGMSVNPPTIDLKVGDNSQIVANVIPVESTNKAISYLSSDPSIASVDANGLVTANSKGTVIIKLTAEGIKEGSTQVTTNVLVNVTEKDSGGSSGGGGSSGSGSSTSSLTLSLTSVELSPNATSTISVKTEDVIITSATSSDTKIVSVVTCTKDTCTIKAISTGSAKITISGKNSSGKTYTGTVSVKVGNNSNSDDNDSTDNGSLSLSANSVNLSPNATSTISVKTEDVTISSASSNNTKVVSVVGCTKDTCTIKAISTGSAKITISAKNSSGKTYTATVSVSVNNSAGTLTCTNWSKSTSEVIFKVEDTSACNIFDVNDCNGEECTVCENKKYSYSYKHKKTDGKIYISYYKTGYNTTNDALTACKLNLASLAGECAKATLNGETCEKSPVDNSCSTYPIYNRVKYKRTCS